MGTAGVPQLLLVTSCKMLNCIISAGGVHMLKVSLAKAFAL